MNNKYQISYCIPLKNNLRYFKRCYESIKKNSNLNHEIVVYLDENNDNTEQFLIDNNIKYAKNKTNKCKGIAHGYNECTKMSDSDVLLFFHADMILGKNADSNALKLLKPKTVISLTRIEPPLHPPGKEKIIMNFGLWPESNVSDGFNEKLFNVFVENNANTNKTTNGIFAPWIIYKEDIMSIGLHDELFHSYHEDSDIFNRFLLSNFKLIQTWDALVYHLNCRGGQFQDGLSITKDHSFHKMKKDCAFNYIRKWGNWIKNDEYSYPIIKNKYNIGFVIRNCNQNVISALEPWCSSIYVDCNFNDYINNNQSDTLFNLKNRIKFLNDEKINDIVIEFDGTQLRNEKYTFITEQLSDVITDSGEIGIMEYDIFKITINSLNTYQKNLIVCK